MPRIQISLDGEVISDFPDVVQDNRDIFLEMASQFESVVDSHDSQMIEMRDELIAEGESYSTLALRGITK